MNPLVTVEDAPIFQMRSLSMGQGSWRAVAELECAGRPGCGTQPWVVTLFPYRGRGGTDQVRCQDHSSNAGTWQSRCWGDLLALS